MRDFLTNSIIESFLRNNKGLYLKIKQTQQQRKKNRNREKEKKRTKHRYMDRFAYYG